MTDLLQPKWLVFWREQLRVHFYLARATRNAQRADVRRGRPRGV